MAIEDALTALPEHVDDVASRLGEAKTRELLDFIDQLEGPSRKRALARITDLLVEGLPPEHPVRRALVEGYLFTSATLDLTALTGALKDWVTVPAPESPAERIVREVTGRLLRAPALSADEVRERGGDPADPALIRLDRPDGGQQWPAFQFAPGGGPLAVVRKVNQLLDAAGYPLGAADWWLSRNGWLGEQPSLLIGTVPDDHLVGAARAIRSEV
ncbi:MAG TPA: hypothetical protein VFQ68_02630 [Streptosporangiaceae bacterium]|nr:hypothetical protein [Streptosporangiaceae bacterium]